MQQSIQNMQAQQQSVINGKLTNAKQLNQIIIPQVVPEENLKAMNNVNFNLQLYGDTVAASFIPVVLPIAQQCPYSGGKAVYQARVFIYEYYDNSLEYGDETTCLQQGIYRHANNEISKEILTANNFIIIPNPASNYFQIQIAKPAKGVCKLLIYDSLNKLKQNEILDCSLANHSISTFKLVSGVYHIKLITEDGTVFVKKLSVIK